MAGYKGRLVDNAIPNIRNPDDPDASEEYILEFDADTKLFNTSERPKKLDPLPTEVLESQACAACGRSRSDPRNKVERYKFHPFPAYEIGRCLRWCQFLGREDLLKMSPNQIRKLVLCSKHFQTGQNFHKIGPCDAIPTIKDISETNNIGGIEQLNEEEIINESNYPNATRNVRKNNSSMPLVSSKKPKIDNKPTPLAKKRGKCRRPTVINIPRPDPNNIENLMIKKLPLPPTPNWKLQHVDQYQPITITNSITSNISAISSNIKKVILPFNGDISSLGNPIPVHSLSSIPPGLLIKIDLPEQEKQKPIKKIKKQNKVKNSQLAAAGTNEQVKVKNCHTINRVPIIKREEADKSLIELLSVSPEPMTDAFKPGELEEQEEVMLPHDYEVLEDEYENFEEVEVLPVKQQKRANTAKKRKTMRRTIFPIQSEVKYFLHKITPHMQKLPARARAQIKLAIVNMVIDRL